MPTDTVTWQSSVATLASENILLRDFVPADWEAVHAYAADPEVVRFMSWGPNTPEQSMGFVAGAVVTAHSRPRTIFDLAVITLYDRKLVGAATLHIKSGREYEAEIGYCLRASAWGKGFGSDTARLLVHFGFNHLHLHRIVATCDPENKASARVLEKAGLKREGFMREHLQVRTGWRDSLLYAILDTDFRPILNQPAS